MAENKGVVTRYQAKKLRDDPSLHTHPEKHVLGSRDGVARRKGEAAPAEGSSSVANRRSYPPDPWMLDGSGSNLTAKQRRTLCDRDHNVFRHEREMGGQGAVTKGSRHNLGRQAQASGALQSCSAGVLQVSRSARKKERHTGRPYQLYLSSMLPLPDPPADDEYPPVTPPRHVRPVPDGIEDIDADSDSLQTNVYARDIMEYLRHLETTGILKPDFLDNSPDVTTRMRGVLMDWILQVQSHEELREETLHLCVAFVDQVLSQVTVKMSQLQLVGITCLLIASKFRERFAPEITVLCYLTENTFVPDEVVRYEMFALFILDFRLNRPVCTTFLDRFLQVHHHPAQVDHLARYILDLTITAVAMVPVLPSLKAASALYLARMLLLDSWSPWSPALVFYTNYEVEDVQETMRELAVLLLKAPDSKFQGARSKYNSKEFSFISVCERVEPTFVLLRCFAKVVEAV